MRIKVVVAAVLVFLTVDVGSAQAINGPWAVRHIKRVVDEDCHSYRAEGAVCLYWEVGHCYKLGRRKVRCKALQQYRVNGNWRECRFHASAVKERHGPYVHFFFGQTQCYSASGAPIP